MLRDSAKADRWTSLVLFGLGAAMLVGGFTMDRLEIRQIHPASIPGLVPMILGGAMMLCAGLLFWSARRGAGSDAANLVSADYHPQASAPPADGSIKNLGFAAGYSVIYALGLVGEVPFWLATAIYIAVFYIHFSWKTGASATQRVLHMAGGVGFGLLGAVAVSTLFAEGFLVRLP
ncbi:MAG: tripartite tricarboxylate transporter TctB family protein [Pseudomonadota bacterium]